MSRALVLSGHGRYADPWHPFAATSAILATVLREGGHDVTISTDVEESLANLAQIELLVVNAGNPARAGEGPSPAVPMARQGLLDFRRRGGGVLAMHAAASSLPHIDEWPEIMGGRWVPGVSMHPPIGTAQIKIHDSRHPVSAGITHLTTVDERYSYLHAQPRVTVLGSHSQDNGEHAMIWALDGHARTVYVGLGHDEQAYEAEPVRRLVRQAADWATGSR